MFDSGADRPTEPGGWGLFSSLRLAVLLLASSLALPGCSALTNAIGGGPARTVDAHVVYRLRADCTTLLARTLRNGYSVMTPISEAFVAEETGLFEGPVREGQSIYRYYPPTESQEWSGDWTEVSVDVRFVRLDLRGAREALDSICGPLVEGEASDAVPRLPDTQNR